MKKRTIALIGILAVSVMMFALLPFEIPDGVLSVTVNGEEITDPAAKAAWGTFGIVVAIVAVVFSLVVTVLALSGAGLIVLGTFVLVGLILVGVALPFLLPVIIPLCLVVFVYLVKPRANKRLETRS